MRPVADRSVTRVLAVLMRGLLAITAFALGAKVTPPMLLNAISPNIATNFGHSKQALAGGDTLLASPWIQERVMRVWTASKRAAYCVNSYATWPRFYFLRHMTEAKKPECPGSTPLFVQGPCPGEVRPQGTPAFVVVQCGPNVFRLYHRNQPMLRQAE